MIGNITSIAVKNNVLSYFLVFCLVIFGAQAYFSLPKAQDPGFTIRTVVITTQLPGANPELIEQLVTDKIEQVVQQMPEVDNITSSSKFGVSVVNVNFKQGYEQMRPIFDSLRRKVDVAKGDLPEGAVGPFINDEYGSVFGIIYTITGDGFNYAELKIVADEVRDELLLISQVAKVEIHGAQQEVIFVEYNDGKLRKLGLSPQQLRNTLQSINIISSGGSILIAPERITLETSGNFKSLEDIKRAVINIPGSKKMVYLEDIAKVYRSYKDPRDKSMHTNGKPSIAVAVSMKEGGNILELGTILNKIMPGIKARYPHGISFDTLAFQPELVNTSINSFINSLIQAVIIVALTMFIFLGLRTGFVISMLVPITMAVTFLVMQFFEVGINKMSLAALIISLGLLVDNGIVMAEGILVRLENGSKKVAAAIETGKEMAVPLLISSLTTSAAFLPILLAKSDVGEFAGDISRVVIMALTISWFLAMTITPLLAINIIKLKKKDSNSNFYNKLQTGYKVILNLALKNKTIFLALIVFVFYLGIKGFSLVPVVFIPASTDPVINTKFDMPYGTSIEKTEEVAYDIEKFLEENWLINDKKKEGVVNWMTFVGSNAPRFALVYSPGVPSERHFSIIINTTDYRLITELSKSVTEYTKKKYPDLQVQIKQLENGPPVAFPIQIRLLGKDKDTLYNLSEQLKKYLYTIDKVSMVNDSWGMKVKKLLIKVNQEKARRAGVSSQDIAASLQANLSGTELSQYRENNNIIPITMRSLSSERQNLDKLENMTIYSSSLSKQVPLKQVANIQVAFEPGIVERRNRLVVMTINVQLKEGFTATEVNKILLPWLNKQQESWPQGVFYEEGGEAEGSEDAQQSIMDALPMAVIIIVLLLVAQFNSIRKPIIILLTIPLGIIGVSAGLIIANSIFGFFTMLAIISLSGIIINNAIVLLDRINIEIIENGLSEQNAIFEACQQRLRPILLTTASTIGGMLPLWLSHDAMFETMSVAIIFGLLFATILTLVFVPVMYSILFRVSFNESTDNLSKA